MANSLLSRSSPKKSRKKKISLETALNRMAHPTSAAMKLPAFFEEDRLAVDAALEEFLPQVSARPASIHQAMRYSVFAGGKRIRPILCIETARVFTPDIAAALHPACAIEMIHTYSLIHDDLPALDNDDLRRAKPIAAAQSVAIVREVASAAGTIDGMVGGQVADIEAEGRKIQPEMLEYIHRSKTAALIRASVTAGALCASAPADDVARVRRFGETIGWAFQVTDDILDVEESSVALGKTAGKDIAQQKATYPAIHGLQRSHEIAHDLAGKAIAELAPYGDAASRLRAIAEYLVLRRA